MGAKSLSNKDLEDCELWIQISVEGGELESNPVPSRSLVGYANAPVPKLLLSSVSHEGFSSLNCCEKIVLDLQPVGHWKGELNISNGRIERQRRAIPDFPFMLPILHGQSASVCEVEAKPRYVIVDEIVWKQCLQDEFQQFYEISKSRFDVLQKSMLSFPGKLRVSVGSIGKAREQLIWNPPWPEFGTLEDRLEATAAKIKASKQWIIFASGRQIIRLAAARVLLQEILSPMATLANDKVWMLRKAASGDPVAPGTAREVADVAASLASVACQIEAETSARSGQNWSAHYSSLTSMSVFDASVMARCKASDTALERSFRIQVSAACRMLSGRRTRCLDLRQELEGMDSAIGKGSVRMLVDSIQGLLVHLRQQKRNSGDIFQDDRFSQTLFAAASGLRGALQSDPCGSVRLSAVNAIHELALGILKLHFNARSCKNQTSILLKICQIDLEQEVKNLEAGSQKNHMFQRYSHFWWWAVSALANAAIEDSDPALRKASIDAAISTTRAAVGLVGLWPAEVVAFGLGCRNDVDYNDWELNLEIGVLDPIKFDGFGCELARPMFLRVCHLRDKLNGSSFSSLADYEIFDDPSEVVMKSSSLQLFKEPFSFRGSDDPGEVYSQQSDPNLNLWAAKTPSTVSWQKWFGSAGDDGEHIFVVDLVESFEYSLSDCEGKEERVLARSIAYAWELAEAGRILPMWPCCKRLALTVQAIDVRVPAGIWGEVHLMLVLRGQGGRLLHATNPLTLSTADIFQKKDPNEKGRILEWSSFSVPLDSDDSEYPLTLEIWDHSCAGDHARLAVRPTTLSELINSSASLESAASEAAAASCRAAHLAAKLAACADTDDRRLAATAALKLSAAKIDAVNAVNAAADAGLLSLRPILTTSSTAAWSHNLPARALRVARALVSDPLKWYPPLSRDFCGLQDRDCCRLVILSSTSDSRAESLQNQHNFCREHSGNFNGAGLISLLGPGAPDCTTSPSALSRVRAALAIRGQADAEASVRLSATSALGSLGQRGDERALERLRACALLDSSASVRLEAINSLLSISWPGDANFMDLLLQIAAGYCCATQDEGTQPVDTAKCETQQMARQAADSDPTVREGAFNVLRIFCEKDELMLQSCGSKLSGFVRVCGGIECGAELKRRARREITFARSSVLSYRSNRIGNLHRQLMIARGLKIVIDDEYRLGPAGGGPSGKAAPTPNGALISEGEDSDIEQSIETGNYTNMDLASERDSKYDQRLSRFYEELPQRLLLLLSVLQRGLWAVEDLESATDSADNETSQGSLAREIDRVIKYHSPPTDGTKTTFSINFLQDIRSWLTRRSVAAVEVADAATEYPAATVGGFANSGGNWLYGWAAEERRRVDEHAATLAFAALDLAHEEPALREIGQIAKQARTRAEWFCNAADAARASLQFRRSTILELKQENCEEVSRMHDCARMQCSGLLPIEGERKWGTAENHASERAVKNQTELAAVAGSSQDGHLRFRAVFPVLSVHFSCIARQFKSKFYRFRNQSSVANLKVEGEIVFTCIWRPPMTFYGYKGDGGKFPVDNTGEATHAAEAASLEYNARKRLWWMLGRERDLEGRLAVFCVQSNAFAAAVECIRRAAEAAARAVIFVLTAPFQDSGNFLKERQPSDSSVECQLDFVKVVMSARELLSTSANRSLMAVAFLSSKEAQNLCDGDWIEVAAAPSKVASIAAATQASCLDSNPGVRRAACEALGMIARPPFGCSNSDRAALIFEIQALESARNALCAALGGCMTNTDFDEDESVRMAAARALGWAGGQWNQKVLRTLEKAALGDNSAFVRESSSAAVAQLTISDERERFATFLRKQAQQNALEAAAFANELKNRLKHTVLGRLHIEMARFRSFDLEWLVGPPGGSELISWPHSRHYGTFGVKPAQIPSPLQLAHAGYYFSPIPGVSDRCVCYCCNVARSGWTGGASALAAMKHGSQSAEKQDRDDINFGKGHSNSCSHRATVLKTNFAAALELELPESEDETEGGVEEKLGNSILKVANALESVRKEIEGYQWIEYRCDLELRDLKQGAEKVARNMTPCLADSCPEVVDNALVIQGHCNRDSGKEFSGIGSGRESNESHTTAKNVRKLDKQQDEEKVGNFQDCDENAIAGFLETFVDELNKNSDSRINKSTTSQHDEVCHDWWTQE